MDSTVIENELNQSNNKLATEKLIRIWIGSALFFSFLFTLSK